MPGNPSVLELQACVGTPLSWSCTHAWEPLCLGAARMPGNPSVLELHTCQATPLSWSCTHARQLLCPGVAHMLGSPSVLELHTCLGAPLSWSCTHAWELQCPGAARMRGSPSVLELHLELLLHLQADLVNDLCWFPDIYVSPICSLIFLTFPVLSAFVAVCLCSSCMYQFFAVIVSLFV